MCLELEIRYPQNVLEGGVLHGHEYRIIHNEMGHRCGYVKVEAGHPWHGKAWQKIDAAVHGGLTFSGHDVPCEKEGPDAGYWVGFDCGHCTDLPDLDLIEDAWLKEFYRDKNDRTLAIDAEYGLFEHSVKDTAYVREQCESLAKQAAQAVAA